MFKTHCFSVQRYAQRNANNFSDTVLMVALSIQQNWLSVGTQLTEVRANKEDSKYLWGNKANTYRYLKANQHKMYAQVMAVINGQRSDYLKSISLMNIFLRVDGLGLAKAGFCCQLVAGLVGCMDVHNIKMYDIDAKDLQLAKNPKTQKGRDANATKIANYIDMCSDYGCENLWNSWCENLATKSKHWQDGNHVSEVHYTYLTGESST